MMKLVNMLDLGSSAARLMGSSPITRTSSEIPTTVPFPALPKTALWWEFLRFRPRFASLDSWPRGDGRYGLGLYLFCQRNTNQQNPNLFPIGDGFGFVVYLDNINA